MTSLRARNVAVAINSLRHTHRESVDQVTFEPDNEDAIGETIKNACAKDGVTKGKRLAYLNAFVKLLQKRRLGDKEKEKFSVKSILFCLRVCLVHEATVVRLATLRVLRYLISSEDDLVAMVETGIPFLVVRSLDIVLNNSAERLQASRLVQKMLGVPGGAKHFPAEIARALIAIGFDGHGEGDKLYRVSLSLLCQLALLNPSIFLECGGVRVLLHNTLCSSSPMVVEAMIGSLLHLLNVPETREASGLNLQALVAPFTDVHFKHGPNERSEKDVDEREIGYQCARTAILAVLKSWSGVAHFCQSKNSGLQALVDALYIEQLEIRRIILDLICEILGVKFPTWSDEVSVALSAIDPSSPQDCWKLGEGFVIAEAQSILPHLAETTPNITANHMALIVLSFIQRGLLEALVEVIVTGDTFMSVRGTVLLGELLYLVDKYIPLNCYDPSECVPSLINYSTSSSSPKQQRAMEALSVLTTLQKIKARAPSPHSVFLQSQLDYASYQPKTQGIFVNKLGQLQVNRLLKREMETNPIKLLKDTGVLNSKDSTTWQWDSIISLLKWAPGPLKRVEESNWRNFLKRLVDYFKPSGNLFARIETGKRQSKIIANTAITLVTFLAESVENFSGALLLEELLVDIASMLDQVLRQPHNPFPAFFSPLKLETTLSATYFLLLGRLSHSLQGYRILEKGEIPQRLLNMVNNVQHECYAKLIIASLSYREEYCKRILGAALCCQFDNTRFFATQFLRILVRSKLSGFSKWGMELLVNQLGDNNKSISRAALDILEEAIHDKMFLESMIALRPTLTHLGDRGLLLLVCFLSLPSGFKFLMEANFLQNEILRWNTSFNKRYVELVEVLVRDSVSTLRRGDDGKYPERASRHKGQPKFVDIYVPPHLYGQLAQHKDGIELLLESGGINRLIDTVNDMKCDNAEETRELKAALWALAHFGSSSDTVPLLEEGKVIKSMVDLARFCPVLSVRHTVFHCMCLICVTGTGTDALQKYDWYGMPRNHHESYTIWGPAQYEEIEKKRLVRLRVERELPEEVDEEGEEDEDKRSSGSNIVNEEELLMMDEESLLLGDDEELKSSSLTTSSPLKWSHAHHRSQSDSLAVRKAPVRSTGWRLRKDSIGGESATTSGVSSCESGVGRGPLDRLQTLSPIPSSASINDQQSPPSRASSRTTLTEPMGVVSIRKGSWSSPAHRSLRLRKPILRMPLLSDSSERPRTISKTGSLDRQFVFSPGDLFESKLMMRVNSSRTSLSSPSFRMRPETKGPAFMGLCVPLDFEALFLTEIPPQVHSQLGSEEGNDELGLGNTFEYHTPSNCLACLGKGVEQENRATGVQEIRAEILRLVSNLICCVGAKANEQGLLRLKQKWPEAFHDLCLYSELSMVMSKYNLRLPLRRFLQELFYEQPFDEFHQLVEEILKKQQQQTSQEELDKK